MLRRLSPDQIMSIFRDPKYRWNDVPGSEQLFAHWMMNPDDPHLKEWIGCLAENQLAKAVASNDIMRPNYPPQGAILADGPSICVGVMPTGDPLPLPLRQVAHNICIAGRTGSGKTTLAMSLALQLVRLGACVVVFDEKGTWRRLLGLRKG